MPHGEDEVLDRYLLASIAHGDPHAQRAMEIFYERHSRRTYAFLRRHLGDDAAAEDVLQEVFWQVWRQAGRYHPQRGSVRAWLYALARSRLLDHQRRVWRAWRAAEEAAAQLSPTLTAWPEHVEMRQDLRQALSRVSPGEEEVLALAFGLGLTQAQIARRLGLPLGTVKSRMRSALLRLRQLVAGSPGEGPLTPPSAAPSEAPRSTSPSAPPVSSPEGGFAGLDP
jgi:RNA polymerase sigma-70 factor (ECF subfamily)